MNMQAEKHKAIILFAHGSRDSTWRRPIEGVAARAALLDPTLLVRCAYLELMEPDLPACVAGLVESGVREIEIVPMFLGVGRHIREDLPSIAAQLTSGFPQVRISLRATLGEDDRVLDLLARWVTDPVHR